MRVPRVRFTVRRMMVSVAIVGLFLGLFAWLQSRTTTFRRIAADHGLEGTLLLVAGGRKDTPVIIYHRNMELKYYLAARRPWLSVEPDPPEPE